MLPRGRFRPVERTPIGSDAQNRHDGRLDLLNALDECTATVGEFLFAEFVGSGGSNRHHIGDPDTAIQQVGEVGRFISGCRVNPPVKHAGTEQRWIEPVAGRGEMGPYGGRQKPWIDPDKKQPYLGPDQIGHRRAPESLQFGTTESHDNTVGRADL